MLAGLREVRLAPRATWLTAVLTRREVGHPTGRAVSRFDLAAPLEDLDAD